MPATFNPAFPAVFPRFVQHAIWRYCAQSGLDVCNGNRIDDRKSCENVYCQIHNICDRIALYNNQYNLSSYRVITSNIAFDYNEAVDLVFNCKPRKGSLVLSRMRIELP